LLATAPGHPYRPTVGSSGGCLLEQLRRLSGPKISNHGQYVDKDISREIKVYRHGDARLTFEDLFARLIVFASWCRSEAQTSEQLEAHREQCLGR